MYNNLSQILTSYPLLGIQKTTRKENLDKIGIAENNFLLLDLRRKWIRRKNEQKVAHGAIFPTNMHRKMENWM